MMMFFMCVKVCVKSIVNQMNVLAGSFFIKKQIISISYIYNMMLFIDYGAFDRLFLLAQKGYACTYGFVL